MFDDLKFDNTNLKHCVNRFDYNDCGNCYGCNFCDDCECCINCEKLNHKKYVIGDNEYKNFDDWLINGLKYKNLSEKFEQ